MSTVSCFYRIHSDIIPCISPILAKPLWLAVLRPPGILGAVPLLAASFTGKFFPNTSKHYIIWVYLSCDAPAALPYYRVLWVPRFFASVIYHQTLYILMMGYHSDKIGSTFERSIYSRVLACKLYLLILNRARKGAEWYA